MPRVFILSGPRLSVLPPSMSSSRDGLVTASGVFGAARGASLSNADGGHFLGLCVLGECGSEGLRGRRGFNSNARREIILGHGMISIKQSITPHHLDKSGRNRETLLDRIQLPQWGSLSFPAMIVQYVGSTSVADGR